MQQQQQNDSQQKQNIKYAIRTYIHNIYTTHKTINAQRTHNTHAHNAYELVQHHGRHCLPRSHCQQQESLPWATWLETVVTPGKLFHVLIGRHV